MINHKKLNARIKFNISAIVLDGRKIFFLIGTAEAKNSNSKIWTFHYLIKEPQNKEAKIKF